MIVVNPSSARVVHTSNVTVCEIEQLLRLRDQSMLQVIPGPVRENEVSNEMMSVANVIPPSLAPPTARSVPSSMPSTGTRLPPELWSYMVDTVTVHTRVDKRAITAFTLVCRWWATHWRRHLFGTIALNCSEDVRVLAELLQFETPHLPSVRLDVKNLTLTQLQYTRGRPKVFPWIHTFYMLLPKDFWADSSQLSIRLELDVGMDGMYVHANKQVRRTLHHVLPQPVPTLHPHCHDLKLSHAYFRSALDVIHLVKKLHVLRSIELASVMWDDDPAYRPDPSTIRSLTLINTGSKYPCVFGLLAYRKIGSTVYELASYDTVLGILRALDLSSAKSNFRYDVTESSGPHGHVCVTFHLGGAILSCSADASDRIEPRRQPHGKKAAAERFALRVRHLVVLTDESPTTGTGVFGNRPDWYQVGILATQLATLQRVVIGFTHRDAMQNISNALRSFNSDKLSFAYTTGFTMVVTKSETTNHVWTEVHPVTLKDTGRKCPFTVFNFAQAVRDSWRETSETGTKNVRGLEALCETCSVCGSA